jgi:pre-peptidase/thrombospondin type 3 repeat protein
MSPARREGRVAATPLLFFLIGALAPIIALADLRREVETNDSAAVAQPLLAPESVGGHIAVPGDRDFYAIRIRPGGTIQASILARGFRADTAPGSSLTARLSILSSDGVTPLAQDVSQGGFDDPAVSVQVSQGGVFYVEVEDLNGLGGPDYPYLLSVEEEGNGDFPTATPLQPPVLASIDTLIWPAGDHDVYRFDAAAGQTATIDMDSAVFEPNVPPVKGVLTLYAPDHTVLASDAYSVSDPNDPYLSVTLPVSGTYFLDVHDLRGFVGTSTSLYQLSVELGPSASNDAPAGAEPVADARGLSGTLCPAGDRDDARASLASPATLLADLDAREDLGSLLDGSLSIMDGSGGLLVENASTPDPAVSAALPAGGAIVAVAGTSGGLCEDAYWQLFIDADLDADGLRLPQDNCPGAFNPGQEDQDHDGIGDACDVCVAVFNPGQQAPLRVQEPVADTLDFSQEAGDPALSWTPAPNSIASNVYRVLVTTIGTLLSFTCRADNVVGPAYVDPDRPAAGSAFFYVVTGENCGESGAGTDSSGQPEIFTNCPAPI